MGYSERKADVLTHRAYVNTSIKVTDFFIKTFEEEMNEIINSNKHSDKVIELLNEDKTEMIRRLKIRSEFMSRNKNDRKYGTFR